MADAAGIDFLVNKTDWKQHRFEDTPVPDLESGQVLFRVDRFAFTANNISYALTGDMLGSCVDWLGGSGGFSLAAWPTTDSAHSWPALPPAPPTREHCVPAPGRWWRPRGTSRVTATARCPPPRRLCASTRILRRRM